MEDLKVRTRRFAVRIVRLYAALPQRGAARVLGEQVLRSGTSVGAHYRESIRSRSAAEYAAKLNAGLMELEESLYWLELLADAGLMSSTRLSSLADEAGQLTAIFVSLIKRARKRS